MPLALLRSYGQYARSPNPRRDRGPLDPADRPRVAAGRLAALHRPAHALPGIAPTCWRTGSASWRQPASFAASRRRADRTTVFSLTRAASGCARSSTNGTVGLPYMVEGPARAMSSRSVAGLAAELFLEDRRPEEAPVSLRCEPTSGPSSGDDRRGRAIGVRRQLRERRRDSRGPAPRDPGLLSGGRRPGHRP